MSKFMTDYKISRRTSLLFMCAAAMTSGVRAETYPSRPIRILTGFTVGATDVLARLYAQKISEEFGTPVVVEAKPGAAQLVAIQALMMAPPDGYTLYLGTGSSLAQGPGMRSDLPYEPLKDFTLISQVASTPGVVVVHPSLPVQNMRDLVNYAEANPGKLNYGSAGVGTASHLQMELLQSHMGIKLTHIPYKNEADMVMAMTQGDVHVAIGTIQGTLPLVTAGKVRPLVVTSRKRVPSLPEVLGLEEQGLEGLEVLDPYSFFGLVGPAGMPSGLVDRLSDVVNRATALPDVAKRVQETLYAEPVVSSPGAFKTLIEQELEKWAQVGKTVKLGP